MRPRADRLACCAILAGALFCAPALAGANMNVFGSGEGHVAGLVNESEGIAGHEMAFHTADHAVLTSRGPVTTLFSDAQVRRGQESGGVVMQIQLFSDPYNPATPNGAATSTGGSLPEPENILLLGLSLLGIVGRSSWRRVF